MDLNQIIALLPYLAIGLVFWLLIIRPQSKKRKEEKQFTESLKVGDRVVTTSGIHGKINQVNTEKATVLIETGAGKITFEQSAISLELSKKLQNEKEKK